MTALQDFLTKTHLAHPLAAWIYFTPFMLFGFAWEGAFLVFGFYLGWEIMQRVDEIRNEPGRCCSLISHVWPWEPFKVWEWSKDKHLDLWPLLYLFVVASVV